MDKNIEAWVASCRRCQETRSCPPAAPIQEWETPRGPWSRIHIDFAGPTNGHTFLLTVDAYSNWLEVSDMTSTTTEAVIKELNKLFSTHGLPDILVSDNGPQFTALEFEKFLAEKGIRHALTAPAHPAANGRAERMVQFTKKTIQKLETGNMQEKINKLLFIQHITPNTTTNKSPAELLMGRKLRSPLDRIHPAYQPERPTDSTSWHRTFKPGDRVYAKNLRGDPLWVPATITQATGPHSYRLETTDGRAWKRHIDQLRSRRSTENTTDTPPQQKQSLNPNQEGREDSTTKTNPDQSKDNHSEMKENHQYSPDPEDDQTAVPPRRTTRASSTDPAEPGGSGTKRGSTCPGRPGGSRTNRPNSPFQGVPLDQHREVQTPTEQVGAQPPTDLRKSSRQVRRPAYLRDYVT